MIVVDASALAAFILKEEGWKDLSAYLAYALSVDHVVKEVVNSIWKAVFLRKHMSESEAKAAYRLLMTMIGKNVVLVSEIGYLDRALEIALEQGVTVYDALYIALAKDKGVPLLTLDEKQRTIANKLGLTVKP